MILKGEKLIVDFVPNIPLAWLSKIPGNRAGYVHQLALYIWLVKGLKKSSENLPIIHKDMQNYFNIDKSSFSKALKELESYGMIAIQGTGQNKTVNINCAEYYGPRVKVKH